ncbi:MAG: Dam family site-specific DNA-(adenine-N6)-methyltransferase, partial [Candidatus Electryonea clarkiae]|nr:Dam family site-specific DNA-(adenine-N6)-methyltransferase [Candidatus Electryonea clarkiae]
IQNSEITSSTARVFLECEGKKLESSDGEYYYEVRTRFNETGSPLDFLFLNRACFNGMIRFNKKGGFNVPFCRKPTRFAPAYVTKICNQIKSVSEIISYGSYEFRCQSFDETIKMATGDDFIYCDPPYIGRHVDYFNGWDENHEKLLKRCLEETHTKFILSTWHSNDYRENEYLKTLWAEYHCLTREHFYHVGAKEKNRNPMLEALVTNFRAVYSEEPTIAKEQLILLEKGEKYLANKNIEPTWTTPVDSVKV